MISNPSLSASKKKKVDSALKPNETVSAEDQIIDDSPTKESDKEEYELIGHSGPVFAVTISICDKHLLSGSYDNTIRRWSLQTKGPLMVYYGHN